MCDVDAVPDVMLGDEALLAGKPVEDCACGGTKITVRLLVSKRIPRIVKQ